MLTLYRKRETKKRPSAHKQELKKLYNTSEVYHSSSSLGSEGGGGPHLFHDLKPLSRESRHACLLPQSWPPGAAFSLLSEGGAVRGGPSGPSSDLLWVLWPWALTAWGASPPPCCLQEQPTDFPQHCQHTAGNNAHPALGRLTQVVKESSYWCRVKLLPWWLIMRQKHTLMGKRGWDVNKHKLYPFVLGKGVIDHQVLLPNNLPRVCDVLERKKTHTQRSEATALQGLIKKTITLLKVQLTISLTLLYHALSSLILLIHWLLSWGRTQRKSCQKKRKTFIKILRICETMLKGITWKLNKIHSWYFTLISPFQLSIICGDI